jgi:glucosamine-6-phosphate deaminase
LQDKIFIFRHAFYETGHIKKPISDEDIAIVTAIIKNKTTSGFAAGDLADPHGTRSLLEYYFSCNETIKTQSYMHDCWLWLYRGAWHEGTSRNRYGSAFKSKRSTIEKKRYFYHQSQKDRVMYQGNDSREFWVRAEDQINIPLDFMMS